ncbi:MAG: HypC/HybG/HupF family hydrogenase formation chaperone [Spirochaetales bacterium]|nr:HypC/HybG/HupF family hydrogenase formation chaperone [Spirochaetales bacterium]
MCLAIPMKLIEKKNNAGRVSAGNVMYDVNLALVPEAVIGDYLIIHAGFAIERLDRAEAKKTLDLFREIDEISSGDSDSGPKVSEA